MNRDRILRDHVIGLLEAGGAHASFEAAIGGLPAKARGRRPGRLPHTCWRLLEHLRIAQNDILEFCRNADHVSPPWPDGYWPEADAPPNEEAWTTSVESFRRDLDELKSIVADESTDLMAAITWGDRQTILREAMLAADHNAYHVAQIITVRRLLGAWEV
jgi:hypothetical protein